MASGPNVSSMNVADPNGNDDQDVSPVPYEITAAPNDFNVATLYDFIKSGVVKIPVFQRNYVWDRKRASKLIESLLLGLPIPQIFLYEAGRNNFMVIDGQQRLMSLYYFREGRFPRDDRRVELRRIFDQKGGIPAEVIQDNKYFVPFTLKLPHRSDGSANPFAGLSYDTLGDLKTDFDIKTIRNVIIKQIRPSGDMSSVFEIFSRLNSEGINLERQELRTCLYHSKFLTMLGRANEVQGWRMLYGDPVPDLHMKDIQILLRAFALLCEPYTPSMVRFLDRFADKARTFSDDRVAYLEQLFGSFIEATQNLAPDDLRGQGGAFSITLFESVFVAACQAAYSQQRLVVGLVDPASVAGLAQSEDFSNASSYGTTSTANVNQRLEAARRLIRLT